MSKFLKLKSLMKNGSKKNILSASINQNKRVEIIAYCLMPTHVHFVLKQIAENGISTFMRLVFNSYARYFNIKHHRKGPLWQNRFKNVLVDSDEQLCHLTRYVHLNPIESNLALRPDQWPYSSYLEFINPHKNILKICNYQDVLNMCPEEYIKFVNDADKGHLRQHPVLS